MRTPSLSKTGAGDPLFRIARRIFGMPVERSSARSSSFRNSPMRRFRWRREWRTAPDAATHGQAVLGLAPAGGCARLSCNTVSASHVAGPGPPRHTRSRRGIPCQEATCQRWCRRNIGCQLRQACSSRRARAGRRAFIYRAILAESEVRTGMVGYVVQRLFAGDGAELVNHLIEAGEVDPATLDDLRARWAEQRRGRRGNW